MDKIGLGIITTDEPSTIVLGMEAVRQLIGGVAHDFNNILAVMMGNTEMLEDRIGYDEQAKENIEKLTQSIDRAAFLTDRLLAFSRQQPLAPKVS
jgi:signal transduction histidine kinase